jgi:hypothetical protein
VQSQSIDGETKAQMSAAGEVYQDRFDLLTTYDPHHMESGHLLWANSQVVPLRVKSQSVKRAKNDRLVVYNKNGKRKRGPLE